MDLEQYKECLGQIPFGKRLPSALYVYRDAATRLGEPLDGFLATLEQRYGIPAGFNLLKLRTNELKISFLSYPDFESDPHPALRQAITIDLVTGKARHSDYADNLNPPILHRKETFLPADHPLWKRFRALTQAEESAGLYEHTATIGFKLNWEKLLASNGLMIEGHSLLQAQDTRPASQEQRPAIVIERHKTAMTRYELSKPVKGLLEYGLLKPGVTFFEKRTKQERQRDEDTH